ncbi:MAG: DMT family transporter [Cohaesibacter sp.]|nr:DMT family transporter [Cohaesibacter sp.]MCV6599975.1 DMT family transporter [Cohaesibacter sp.]
MSRLTANLLLLIAAIVWGAAFVAQSTAMDSIGPLSFTGLRFLLGALAVAPFAYWEWRRSTNPVPLKGHKQGLWVGIIFFIAITTQQYGFFTTTVTNAGFLTALYVVFTPLLGLLIFRQSPNPIIWFIVAISLSGTYLLAGGIGGLVTGDMLMIISAIFWALQVLLIGRLVGTYGNPVTIAFVQFLTTGLIGLIAGLALEPLTLNHIAGAWQELLYTGILSGGLAFTLQAIAQRYTAPADAAILLSTESLFAALFGALLLGESLSGSKWLGCALIFCSILLVELLPQLQKLIKSRQPAEQKSL